MGYQDDFFKKYSPYAMKAASVLDMPVSTILAQWAIESTYGTSEVFKNNNNLAGIKKVKSSIALPDPSPSGYARYKDIDQFTQDYIRVMNNGYYEHVKAADTPENTAYALGNSLYAEGTYDKGQHIVDTIKNFNLKQFDGLAAPGPITTHPYGFDKQTITNAVNALSEEDKKLYAFVGACALAAFWLFKEY